MIISSNAELVELWVKGSNRCMMLGKDEKISSVIAICRSSTVFDYEEITKEEVETRKLKGNQYTTSGKKGERIYKKEGQLEVCTKSLREIRGSSYPTIVIRKTMQQNNMLESMRNKANIQSNIRHRITVKGGQYKLAQNDTSVKAYAQLFLSDTSTQIPNVIQRQRDIGATTHMRSDVLYLTMRIMNIPLIQLELTFRGVTFKELWSIKYLVIF